MAWLRGRAALLGLLLGLSAAASTCWHGETGAAPCAGEDDRARAAAGRIERAWPLRGSGPDADFVRALGTRLGAVAGPMPHPWTFVLVRDARPNAFSVGGGRIYLTEGAIRTCETEAELAALLAHEMGHQLSGHFCEAPGRSVAGASSGLRQHVDPRQEREADEASIRLLAAAGYDPRAALAIATRISRLGDGEGRELWDDSRLAELAGIVARAPTGGRTDSKEFQRLRRQLDGTQRRGQ